MEIINLGADDGWPAEPDEGGSGITEPGGLTRFRF
ncbi:MAG: hypothetical protein QOF21_3136 [Actinomycetota bacterium]|jgi:hypothetical protein